MVLAVARKRDCGGTGNLGNGQLGHEEKQQSVARNVQVKVDQTVDKKSSARHQAGKMQSRRKRFAFQEQATKRMEK
jgi:hypothetical protein